MAYGIALPQSHSLGGRQCLAEARKVLLAPKLIERIMSPVEMPHEHFEVLDGLASIAKLTMRYTSKQDASAGFRSKETQSTWRSFLELARCCYAAQPLLAMRYFLHNFFLDGLVMVYARFHMAA